MENYEQKVNEIYKQNEKYLDIFYQALEDEGLAKKTIHRHMDNIGFYINVYLADRLMMTMEKGCHYVDDFLGDWFIRKTLWASEETIKTNCATFKKFYKCMLDHDFITEEDYSMLLFMIKEEKENWIARANEY